MATCGLARSPSLLQIQVWSCLQPGLDHTRSFHHYFACFCSCSRDSPKTVQDIFHKTHRDPLKCCKRKAGRSPSEQTLQSSPTSQIPTLWCGVITRHQWPLIHRHRFPQERPAPGSLLHTNPACRIGTDCQGITSIMRRGLDSSGDFVFEAPQAPESVGCENCDAKPRAPKQSLP